MLHSRATRNNDVFASGRGGLPAINRTDGGHLGEAHINTSGLTGKRTFHGSIRPSCTGFTVQELS